MVLASGAVFSADRASADAYLISCPTLVKDGNFKTVEDMCKRALQADDTCPSAHYYMGLVHEKNNASREAFKCFQLAATNAAKEKDTVTAAKATAAAKRIGQGLMELDTLDVKLAERVQKVAEEAFEAGQLETAKQAYTAWVVLAPDNPKSKEGFDKVTAALLERGDPVRSKVASAMLTEVYYKFGVGQKSEAVQKAKELSNQYSDTEYGKEAAGLLERDFSAPKKEEVAQLAQKVKEKNARLVSLKPAPSVSSSSSSSSSSHASSSSPNKGVDVEATEKMADEETKKMAKTALVPAFTKACKDGQLSYSKATPGSEGNQENVAHALENFIKAESLYQRIETENLINEDLAELSKKASMLRYACLKMTILGH